MPPRGYLHPKSAAAVAEGVGENFTAKVKRERSSDSCRQRAFAWLSFAWLATGFGKSCIMQRVAAALRRRATSAAQLTNLNVRKESLLPLKRKKKDFHGLQMNAQDN